MILILQRQGRTSARRLAEALEVSERTILRDVEVLGEAGVPVLTHRGPHGGIELLDGFRTQLTWLTDDEARSLLLVGQLRVADRLGLGVPARTAREKLLAAIPRALAARAASVDGWFLDDPDPWAAHEVVDRELHRIASAIRGRRCVELFFDGPREAISTRPLGLVRKAASWHLVHLGEEAVEVRSLEGLVSTRRTSVRFSPPTGFDLPAFWQAHLDARAVPSPRRAP